MELIGNIYSEEMKIEGSQFDGFVYVQYCEELVFGCEEI
jgi:hypothetical protein